MNRLEGSSTEGRYLDGNLGQNLGATLGRHWWAILLRGIVAILFGVLTFMRPGISLATLVLFFGAFAFVDGILGTITAIRARHERDDWGVLLLGGLLGIGIGLLTLSAPAITGIALLFYIAIWAIATGVLEIVAAIRLRKYIQGEWLLVLAGLASVAFGVFLMMRPAAGALAVVWIIASYAIVFGGALVALSFRIKGFANRLERGDSFSDRTHGHARMA